MTPSEGRRVQWLKYWEYSNQNEYSKIMWYILEVFGVISIVLKNWHSDPSSSPGWSSLHYFTFVLILLGPFDDDEGVEYVPFKKTFKNQIKGCHSVQWWPWIWQFFFSAQKFVQLTFIYFFQKDFIQACLNILLQLCTIFTEDNKF